MPAQFLLAPVNVLAADAEGCHLAASTSSEHPIPHRCTGRTRGTAAYPPSPSRARGGPLLRRGTGLPLRAAVGGATASKNMADAEGDSAPPAAVSTPIQPLPYLQRCLHTRQGLYSIACSYVVSRLAPPAAQPHLHMPSCPTLLHPYPKRLSGQSSAAD